MSNYHNDSNLIAVIRRRHNFIEWPCAPADTNEVITLKFSDYPSGPGRFVFGSGGRRNVDISFHGPRIKSHQFSIAFDEESKRLKVQGLHVANRMEVLYDDEGRGKRGKFQWLLNGLGTRLVFKKFTIQVDDIPYFDIIYVRQYESDKYMDNVGSFSSRALDPAMLATPCTAPMSEPESSEETVATGTPEPVSNEELFITRDLSSTRYSSVKYFLNVSTAGEYVTKTPKLSYQSDSQESNDRISQNWIKEARLLKKAKHRHILRLIDYQPEPIPTLYLEYAPEGSLSDKILTTGEMYKVAIQSLDGLRHLHSLGITHRDIKPNNILLMGRGENLQIKFCDLGISKDTADLITRSHTPGYAAPELFVPKALPQPGESVQEYFTSAVDIWSIGLTWMKLLGARRPFKRDEWDRDQFAHCKQDLVDLAKFSCGREDQPLVKILKHMVILEPEQRWTAQQLYDTLLLYFRVGKIGTSEAAVGEEVVADTSSNQATLRAQSANSSNPQATEVAGGGSKLRATQQSATITQRSATSSPPLSTQQPPPTQEPPPTQQPVLASQPPLKRRLSSNSIASESGHPEKRLNHTSDSEYAVVKPDAVSPPTTAPCNTSHATMSGSTALESATPVTAPTHIDIHATGAAERQTI